MFVGTAKHDDQKRDNTDLSGTSGDHRHVGLNRVKPGKAGICSRTYNYLNSFGRKYNKSLTDILRKTTVSDNMMSLSLKFLEEIEQSIEISKTWRTKKNLWRSIFLAIISLIGVCKQHLRQKC